MESPVNSPVNEEEVFQENNNIEQSDDADRNSDRTNGVGRIIGHIVGIPSFQKDDITWNLKDKFKYIKFVDIEPVVSKLRNSESLIKLEEKIEKSKKDDARKDARKKLESYWKSIVNDRINDITKRESKSIILLGFANYHKDYRINANVNSGFKIFLKTNEDENAKRTIEHNLDLHREEIVENKFPWDYLKTEYIKNQRQKLSEIYERMGYSKKSFRTVCKTIEFYLKHEGGAVTKSANKLYVCSQEKYTKKQFPLDKKRRIIAYPEEWLALMGWINHSGKVKKGYHVDRHKLTNEEDSLNSLVPVVTELTKNGLDVLKVECTLYEVDRRGFEPYQSMGHLMKYVAYRPVKVIKRSHVANVLRRLIRSKIKIIKVTDKHKKISLSKKKSTSRKATTHSKKASSRREKKKSRRKSTARRSRKDSTRRSKKSSYRKSKKRSKRTSKRNSSRHSRKKSTRSR